MYKHLDTKLEPVMMAALGTFYLTPSLPLTTITEPITHIQICRSKLNPPYHPTPIAALCLCKCAD